MLHGGGIELRGDLNPVQFEPGAGLTHDQEQPDCVLMSRRIRARVAWPPRGARAGDSPCGEDDCGHCRDGGLVGGGYLHCIRGRD